MKKLITIMSSNEFFHFFLFFNFCFTSTCAMEIERKVSLPIELQKIIFFYADFGLKQKLTKTCHSFRDVVAKEFVKEKCSFNDFVDKLYSVPPYSNMFKALCNRQDEHRTTLQNYYFFKGLSQDKKNMIKTDWVKDLVVANGKKRVKYYSDYCNALCCVEVLRRGCDNKSEDIFWFNKISLEELMNHYAYINQNVSEMWSFYMNSDFQKDDGGQDLIKKILESEKISILVLFLSELTKIPEKVTSAISQKIRDIFNNAKTDKLRKLLAKSGYVYDLKKLLDEAIKNQECDKVKCYLEIMLDRGENCDGLKIKDLFNLDLDNMLPDLIEAGFQFLCDDLNKLTANQIKKYVEISYKKNGKNFWSRRDAHMFLHAAAKFGDVELVEYLLSIGVSNGLDDKYMYPIFYSSHNDNDAKIFNILIDQVPVPSSQKEFINEGFLKHKNFSTPFFKENSVIKIIKLFEKGYFNLIDFSWLRAAVDYDNCELFKFLFNELVKTNKINIFNDNKYSLLERAVIQNQEKEKRNQFLLQTALLRKECDNYDENFLLGICSTHILDIKGENMLRILLREGLYDKNFLSSLCSMHGIKDENMLREFLKYGANVFAVKDCELALRLFDDEDAIINYIKSREDITLEQLKNILRTAIAQCKEKLVRYLFENKFNDERIFSSDVNQYTSNNKNMQCILEKYKQKFRKLSDEKPLPILINLMDEQTMINYIASKAEIFKWWQFKHLLNLAIEQNKKEIISYLFDSKKVSLHDVDCCNVDNKALLDECARQGLKEDEINNTINIIRNNEQCKQAKIAKIEAQEQLTNNKQKGDQKIIGFGVIKNIFGLFINALYSFLCFFNPFR